MSLLNARASRVFSRIRTLFAAGCVGALASSLMAGNAHARAFDSRNDGFAHVMQVRGPGFVEERANERANERAMRQAARAQRQQQMEGQRAAQRSEQMQHAPERELAAPQPAERQGEGGRSGRLTPDERRALRQQINQAGRDVYRPNTRP